MSGPNWTIDAQAQRVMMGPTADETAEDQSLLNASDGVPCKEMPARFAALQRRHEATLKHLAAEAQDQPHDAFADTIAPGSNLPIDEDAM